MFLTAHVSLNFGVGRGWGIEMLAKVAENECLNLPDSRILRHPHYPAIAYKTAPVSQQPHLQPRIQVLRIVRRHLKNKQRHGTYLGDLYGIRQDVLQLVVRNRSEDKPVFRDIHNGGNFWANLC
jgi:hypothetical protein